MHSDIPLSWKGDVTIIARYADGSLDVQRLKNLVTSAGKNMLRDALLGLTNDTQIKYVALGSSNSAPAAGQTTLGNEQFRKIVTQSSQGATGVGTTTVYIAPYEANGFTIEEVGWFAGPNATSATNSGILVARVLYHRVKSQLESLQISRDDTLA